MGKTFIAAAAAFVIGAITLGAAQLAAQPAPPGPPGMADNDSAGGWRPGQWMQHHMHGFGTNQGGPAEGMRAMALVYKEKDRALTPSDVQKIAEAFLLWNGNHSWKVANAATNSDGLVAFDLTVPDGSVIAKFTMDPHTAKLVRVG